MDSLISEENEQDPRWMERIQLYILRGHKQKALNYLEKIIGSFLPLFPDDKQVMKDRRIAWLTRIDLLRQMGKSPEALAWICLECELNPENIEAQALKRRMLNILNLTDAPTNSLSQVKLQGKFAWKGVAGMRLLKAQLERDVLLPFLEKELYSLYKIPLPNGILLYGPPGCGKTFVSRKLAKEIGFHFLDIRPSDIASPYVHGTQGLIGKIFETALENAPTMMFFDELDGFVPSRKDTTVGHHYRAEVNEFLTQLDNSAERGLLIIGATNYLENIDEAILRPGRFDKRIYIGPPDIEAREELLRQYMEERPADVIDYVALAQQSNGLTPAELRLVVDEAARNALTDRASITTKYLLLEIQHLITSM